MWSTIAWRCSSTDASTSSLRRCRPRGLIGRVRQSSRVRRSLAPHRSSRSVVRRRRSVSLLFFPRSHRLRSSGPAVRPAWLAGLRLWHRCLEVHARLATVTGKSLHVRRVNRARLRRYSTKRPSSPSGMMKVDTNRSPTPNTHDHPKGHTDPNPQRKEQCRRLHLVMPMVSTSRSTERIVSSWSPRFRR